MNTTNRMRKSKIKFREKTKLFQITVRVHLKTENPFTFVPRHAQSMTETKKNGKFKRKRDEE